MTNMTLQKNAFDVRVEEHTGEALHGIDLDLIQVNIGLTCNLACRHCHVASGPKRREQMDRETMQHILRAAAEARPRLVDITGGAPEMNPHFREFITSLCAQNQAVQVRTNLTIMLEEGYRDLPEFYRDHQVALVASLPCYLQENVDHQRGDGVYWDSVEVLKRLNEVGYGIDEDKVLNLVYNPIAPSLPPAQEPLEAAYKKELAGRFGIRFHHLMTITNMPIGRFFADLRHEKRDEDYMQLLVDGFNEATLPGLMCRHQIEIDWDGNLYDCDFNLALKLGVNHGAPKHIRDFDVKALRQRRIATGSHCFGCTAGCGSSCGGALA